MARKLPAMGIVAVVAAAGLARAAAAGENLAPNPGFESVEPKAGLPAAWRFDWKYTHSGDRQRHADKQRPDFAVDTAAPHSGRRCVRIGVGHREDDGVLSTAAIPLDPAVKVFRAGLWIKTAGLEETTARLAVVAVDEKGGWLGADYTLIAAGENHPWRRYQAFYQPPPGTRAVRLRLWVNFEYSGTGTAWFDDVAFEPTDLEGIPPLEYYDPSPPPEPTEEDRRRGYVPFAGNPLETVYPASIPPPHELGRAVEMIGFPGETEAGSFSIRALEELAEVEILPQRLVAGEAVIPAGRVSAHPVACLVRTGQSRWGPLADEPMLQPVYVEQTSKTSVAEGSTRQVWITVRVPGDAAAGSYTGGITLKTPRSTWTMPVRLTVYPFALPEVPGVAFGMYSRVHENDAFMDAIYADMRGHGMTTVGLCCNLGAEMAVADGRVVVDWTDSAELVRAVRAYRKAGFPEPLVWLMGSDVLRFARRQGELESEQFAAAYGGVLRAVLDHAGSQGWPEIIFQPVDEPFEHTAQLAKAKRCLQIMKTIPGLRTEEDGPNGNPDTLEELYELSDVLVYHDGPWVDRKRYDAGGWEALLARTRRDGKTLWFYNVDLTGYHPEAMRFGYGVGLWRGGARGVIEWAYMFRHGRGPEDQAYENPKFMFYRYPRTKTHAGGPSIGWEAVRQGVEDYKLLSLFYGKLAEAKAGGDARRAATARRLEASAGEQLAKIRFDQLLATAGKGRWTDGVRLLEDGRRVVTGRLKMRNGWAFEDYDRFRRLLAEGLVELSGPAR